MNSPFFSTSIRGNSMTVWNLTGKYTMTYVKNKLIKLINSNIPLTFKYEEKLNDQIMKCIEILNR